MQETQHAGAYHSTPCSGSQQHAVQRNGKSNAAGADFNAQSAADVAVVGESQVTYYGGQQARVSMLAFWFASLYLFLKTGQIDAAFGACLLKYECR